LRAGDGASIYVPSGVAHGYCMTSEWGTLTYLLSSPYAPDLEREIHPLDPELGVTWPLTAPVVLSPKDAAAPSMEMCRQRGDLPSYTGPWSSAVRD
jgi:dTDP-4-dehydrorhamnose 3,5-epimerase